MKYLPQGLSDILKRFMRNRYRQSLSGKTVEQVFTAIYERGVWGTKDNKSGGGSTTEQTREIIQELPKLFQRYKIRSVLDLPCGDFTWMQQVDLSSITYIGGDIVESIINENTARFPSKNKHFQKLDIISDELPRVDLLLCRDCFIHLSQAHILQSLENILRSEIKYLLVTSFTDTPTNVDIITGEWRRVNMELAPFQLQPIAVINERCTVDDGKFADKSLLLIDLKEHRERRA